MQVAWTDYCFQALYLKSVWKANYIPLILNNLTYLCTQIQ